MPLPPNPSRLSQHLNASTHKGHLKNNKMITARLGLAIRSPYAYRTGLRSFLTIYATFESLWTELLSDPSTDQRVATVLRALYSPHLPRTQALLQDLSFFYGLDASDKEGIAMLLEPDTEARRAYAAHIREAVERQPLVLVAYIHTMYLALFAGGRIIKSRVLGSTFLFPAAPGHSSSHTQTHATNLFRFPDVEAGTEDAVVRQGLKEALASVEHLITDSEKEQIVEEAKAIFEYNEKLIFELDEMGRQGMWAVKGQSVAEYGLGGGMVTGGEAGGEQ